MDTIPISALQHWLFCDRQCCLIHLEQEWEDNIHTAEGNLLHSKTDTPADETHGDKRILRALQISSIEFGLFGRADVVELHDNIPYPVEYKRGKPKSHRSDEVQLCAQALCLEEMFNCDIQQGSLYYGQPRRRTEIVFDNELRKLTIDVSVKVREALMNGVLPLPVFEKKKCNNCSLIDICKPKIVSSNTNVQNWVRKQLELEVQ